MRATIDASGRVVIPKPLRESLGLQPGTFVELSCDGTAIRIERAGPTARLVSEDGLLVAASETPIDDAVLRRLLDAGRR